MQISAFSSPLKSESLVRISPPVSHIVSYVTGGYSELFKNIKDPTRLNVKPYGRYTDVEGCFVPEKGMSLLAGRYRFREVIGNGQSAVLIKADDTFFRDKAVSIKVLHRHYSQLGTQEADCVRRLNQADPLCASGTVRLLTMFSFDDHFCMVFELLHPKSLLEYCLHNSSQCLTELKAIALHLLKPLAFLHQQNIIHADLKPENILFKKENDMTSVTLVDFGNALRCVYDELSLYYEDFELQTLLYRAPEVMLGLPFGLAVDMWSFGCIIAELYLGKPIFYGTEKLSVIKKIVKLLGPLPKSIYQTGKFYGKMCQYTADVMDKDAASILIEKLKFTDYRLASFIAGCLHYDPAERMTVFEAARHPFLAEYGITFLSPHFTNGDKRICDMLPSTKVYSNKPVIEFQDAATMNSVDMLRQRGTGDFMANIQTQISNYPIVVKPRNRSKLEQPSTQKSALSENSQISPSNNNRLQVLNSGSETSVCDVSKTNTSRLSIDKNGSLLNNSGIKTDDIVSSVGSHRISAKSSTENNCMQAKLAYLDSANSTVVDKERVSFTQYQDVAPTFGQDPNSFSRKNKKVIMDHKRHLSENDDGSETEFPNSSYEQDRSLTLMSESEFDVTHNGVPLKCDCLSYSGNRSAITTAKSKSSLSEEEKVDNIRKKSLRKPCNRSSKHIKCKVLHGFTEPHVPSNKDSHIDTTLYPQKKTLHYDKSKPLSNDYPLHWDKDSPHTTPCSEKNYDKQIRDFEELTNHSMTRQQSSVGLQIKNYHINIKTEKTSDNDEFTESKNLSSDDRTGKRKRNRSKSKNANGTGKPHAHETITTKHAILNQPTSKKKEYTSNDGHCNTRKTLDRSSSRERCHRSSARCHFSNKGQESSTDSEHEHSLKSVRHKPGKRPPKRRKGSSDSNVNNSSSNGISIQADPKKSHKMENSACRFISNEKSIKAEPLSDRDEMKKKSNCERCIPLGIKEACPVTNKNNSIHSETFTIAENVLKNSNSIESSKSQTELQYSLLRKPLRMDEKRGETSIKKEPKSSSESDSDIILMSVDADESVTPCSHAEVSSDIPHGRGIFKRLDHVQKTRTTSIDDKGWKRDSSPRQEDDLNQFITSNAYVSSKALSSKGICNTGKTQLNRSKMQSTNIDPNRQWLSLLSASQPQELNITSLPSEQTKVNNISSEKNEINKSREGVVIDKMAQRTEENSEYKTKEKVSGSLQCDVTKIMKTATENAQGKKRKFSGKTHEVSLTPHVEKSKRKREAKNQSSDSLEIDQFEGHSKGKSPNGTPRTKQRGRHSVRRNIDSRKNSRKSQCQAAAGKMFDSYDILISDDSSDSCHSGIVHTQKS